MDYEKKYNEALERANKQRADYQKELDKTDKNSQLAGLLRAGISAIDMAFPELRESEDERIRRTLVEYFGPKVQLDFVRGIPIQKIRDWLDKQKELPFVKDVVLGYPGLYYYDGERLHFRGSIVHEEKETKELEKPVPADLEEAAEKEAIEYAEREKPKDADGEIWKVGDVMIENRMSFEDGFIAGAKWQAAHTPLPEDTVLFQKGVEEGKRLMMEEAVEGYVNYYEDSGGILMAEAQVGCPYHNGDKVKIIIVKED